MQIVVIHGGNTFETQSEFLKDAFSRLFQIRIRLPRTRIHRWKKNLPEDLGNDFQVLRPQMPKPHNARYEEWKKTFEELIPSLENEVMLVGHSLGGMFLARYLAQNDFPRGIRATFLVAAAFDSEDIVVNGKKVEKKIPFFAVPDDLSRFSDQSPTIFLYHSKDDPIVPFSELRKFQERLPESVFVRVFEDRQHFGQEHLPELIEDVRSCAG